MNGTKTKIEVEGYEVEYHKTVTYHNEGCGAVYLPIAWVKRKAHVVLLEAPATEQEVKTIRQEQKEKRKRAEA